MKANLRACALMFTVWLIAVGVSNSHLSLIDDEAIQVVDAARPVGEMVSQFWFGRGIHLHPPLPDVLLHFWLSAAGNSLLLLRLPPALFFLAGLLLLALAASDVAGPAAFLPVIYVGLLSPYTFHFARVAGWYSLCFFLVSWLTLAWLRCAAAPGPRRLAGFVLPAILLIYSNYYGWAIVAVLLLDCCIRFRTRGLKMALLVMACLALAYTPLWISFISDTRGHPQSFALASTLLLAGFDLYSLLLSESVAPWFWYLSIPAAIAAGIGGALTFRLLDSTQRRWLGYFFIAFAGLALSGHGDNKRSLFVSAWLILSLGMALAQTRTKRMRWSLILALGYIALTGWTGIVTRRWYSSTHFIEPWAAISRHASDSLHSGEIVFSNSTPFLLHLNYALARPGDPFTPSWTPDPKIFNLMKWRKSPPETPYTVLYVRGVDPYISQNLANIEAGFAQNCTLLESEKFVPDTGSQLKRKLFPHVNQPPFRILAERYKCPAPSTR